MSPTVAFFFSHSGSTLGRTPRQHRLAELIRVAQHDNKLVAVHSLLHHASCVVFQARGVHGPAKHGLHEISQEVEAFLLNGQWSNVTLYACATTFFASWRFCLSLLSESVRKPATYFVDCYSHLGAPVSACSENTRNTRHSGHLPLIRWWSTFSPLPVSGGAIQRGFRGNVQSNIQLIFIIFGGFTTKHLPVMRRLISQLGHSRRSDRRLTGCHPPSSPCPVLGRIVGLQEVGHYRVVPPSRVHDDLVIVFIFVQQ